MHVDFDQLKEVIILQGNAASAVTCSRRPVNTQGDSDVISFHIYACGFRRHFMGKSFIDVPCYDIT